MCSLYFFSIVIPQCGDAIKDRKSDKCVQVWPLASRFLVYSGMVFWVYIKFVQASFNLGIKAYMTQFTTEYPRVMFIELFVRIKCFLTSYTLEFCLHYRLAWRRSYITIILRNIFIGKTQFDAIIIFKTNSMATFILIICQSIQILRIN